MNSVWRLLLSPLFWEQLSGFLVSWFHKDWLSIGVYQVPMKMPQKKINLGLKQAANAEEESPSLLDLPELTLECILERLSPSGLCSMAGVCSSLRDSFKKEPGLVDQSNQKGFLRSLGTVWSFSWIKPKFETRNKPSTSLPVDSIMAMYLSLERGKFWFPAQVYNRENGHVGFLLSCYDAQISYDSKTDTFQARYSPYGRRMIEESIHRDRLRAPPVDTPAHDLHISDCLNDLKPGDHIEIQWRRSKEFPYGWWYATVGHTEACDVNENHCPCQYNEWPQTYQHHRSRGSVGAGSAKLLSSKGKGVQHEECSFDSESSYGYGHSGNIMPLGLSSTSTSDYGYG
ncbi:hypothetical protein GH714_038076 [Hevea brasiliensis]|uniref:F-box domain-containing protein n=1 Tax=Hevea brasiliensis TaxID=3981 RepID=A0A6A6M3L8_HEVBR|nr:hypothetical protein GH714_038076 [Hevea brasiliensis]